MLALFLSSSSYVPAAYVGDILLTFAEAFYLSPVSTWQSFDAGHVCCIDAVDDVETKKSSQRLETRSYSPL
jgi:hypothetical protein